MMLSMFSRKTSMMKFFMSTFEENYLELCFRICIPVDYMKFELPEEGEPTEVSIGKMLNCLFEIWFSFEVIRQIQRPRKLSQQDLFFYVENVAEIPLNY
jgi:hypothetical protein